MALLKQWDGAAWVEVAAQEGVPSIHDTPVDGATTAGISSDWAYDHIDTDGSTSALHHTLGTGANQAAAGNHAHSGVYEPADATILKQASIVNTLVSTSATAPLSAAQGKALNENKIAVGLSSYFAKTDPWSVAWSVTGVNSLVTAQAMHIEVNGLILVIQASRTVTTPASPVAGTDYAIWCHPDGTLEATANHIAAPVSGARKVGGYYYAPGGNATAQAGGDTTPAINPYSCWDLHFRPKANDPCGMTLVAGHFWADIHLLNTNPDVNGTSKHGVTIADGASPPKIPSILGGNGADDYGSLTWYEAVAVLGAFGKRLPTYAEFCLLAFGVAEATSFGSSPSDTALDAPRTSRWGVMQATGNLWTWGNSPGGPYGDASWSNNTEGFGQTYNLPNAALLGGSGLNGAASGSRCSLWHSAPSYSNDAFGARGISDHLVIA